MLVNLTQQHHGFATTLRPLLAAGYGEVSSALGGTASGSQSRCHRTTLQRTTDQRRCLRQHLSRAAVVLRFLLRSIHTSVRTHASQKRSYSSRLGGGAV